MFHIILFEPEIPPNTGNIIRLCANTNCQLHLIHPLGFHLNDKNFKRAGLDYHELIVMQEHKNFESFLKTICPQRIFAIETCGNNTYDRITYHPGDAFLFGPETKGLPQKILNQFPRKNILKIPMKTQQRSINLSNAVAIIIYEAWKQNFFIDQSASPA